MQITHATACCGNSLGSEFDLCATVKELHNDEMRSIAIRKWHSRNFLRWFNLSGPGQGKGKGWNAEENLSFEMEK